MAETGVTGSRLDWATVGALLRRRRWWLLLPLVAGWLAVVSLLWLLPPEYQSQAVLLVDQQAVPRSYVQPNVTFNPGALLQSLGQQVLSHDRLAQIVRQRGLYPRAQARQGLDAAIAQLQKAITIEPVSLSSLPQAADGNWSAIRIAYTAHSAALAQAVDNDLTTLFIQDNLRATQQASEQTTSFLQQQVDHAAAQVQQAREAVQSFEHSHLGTLPGQDQANLAMVMSLQTELNASLAAEQHTQQEIQADRALLAQAPTPAEESRDQELVQLEAQLGTLRSRYTARYPAVLQLEQQIAALRKAPAQKGPAAKGSSASLALSQVKSQLQADEAVLPEQTKASGKLQRELETYEHRLALAPLPAAQLSGLQSQLQQAEGAYQALRGKLDDSMMASQLEAQQGGAQFRLLDAPAQPRKPVWPKPGVLSLLGVGLGLALGVGASAAAELTQDRMRSEAEIVLLGLTPILARVPQLWERSEQARRRRRAGLEWAAGAALVVLLVAGNVLLLRLGA